MPSVPAPWEAAENPAKEPVTGAFVPVSVRGPEWSRVGSSVRGKPIQAITFGTGPRRIYVLAGVRGDEPEGPAAAAEAAELLLEGGPGLNAATIRILRDANPDASGLRSRNNTRGVDLGRNWPAKDWTGGDPRHGAQAASELETIAVQKDLEAFKPDIVVVLSSSVRGPVVAFEGNTQLLAFEFASGARRADPRWRVVPDRWKPAPGSPESYTTLNLKKPVLSLELPRGQASSVNAAALRAGLEMLATAQLNPPAPAPTAAQPKATPPLR